MNQILHFLDSRKVTVTSSMETSEIQIKYKDSYVTEFLKSSKFGKSWRQSKVEY